MSGLTFIDAAQADMRRAYFGGACGVAASAIAWLAAALTAVLVNPTAAIGALFIGGMLIHPAAILLSKLLGRPGAHESGNPLALLAVESTIWLLLAIGVALLASMQRTEWFFIAMMATIGGRYFTFATLYGLRLYWACGATLAVGAVLLVTVNAHVAMIASTAGILELVFAAVVFSSQRQSRLS